MKKGKLILLIIFVLMAGSLACSWGFSNNSTQETVNSTPPPEIHPQNNDPGNLQSPHTSGDRQFILTEEQLTEFIYLQLEGIAGDQVSDIEVDLMDGVVEVSGNMRQRGLTLPVRMVAEVDVDSAGKPNFNILSATAGPFPVPSDMVSDLETSINHAFEEELRSLAPNLQVESIIIRDGLMIISGQNS